MGGLPFVGGAIRTADYGATEFGVQQKTAPAFDRGGFRFRNLGGDCVAAFDLRHFVGERPKGTVQLNVLVDTLYGAGGDAANVVVRVAAHALQPAFDCVFLNHVERGPQVRTRV